MLFMSSPFQVGPLTSIASRNDFFFQDFVQFNEVRRGLLSNLSTQYLSLQFFKGGRHNKKATSMSGQECIAQNRWLNYEPIC